MVRCEAWRRHGFRGGQAIVDQVEQHLQGAVGLADQVPAGHAGIGGVVRHELRDVLGSNEDRLELASQRRREGALAGCLYRQARFGKQGTYLVGEPAFIR